MEQDGYREALADHFQGSGVDVIPSSSQPACSMANMTWRQSIWTDVQTFTFQNLSLFLPRIVFLGRMLTTVSLLGPLQLVALSETRCKRERTHTAQHAWTAVAW